MVNELQTDLAREVEGHGGYRHPLMSSPGKGKPWVWVFISMARRTRKSRARLRLCAEPAATKEEAWV
jgi:hypothetical protein